MATVHVEPVVVTASHNSNEWRQSLDTQTVHPNQSLTRALHMAAAALKHVQSNHEKLTAHMLARIEHDVLFGDIPTKKFKYIFNKE